MLIHIFTGGDRISSAGIKQTYGAKELDQIVETYDPSTHEAPLVFDHEGDDRISPYTSLRGPSAGWVKGLFKRGLDLFADIDLTDLGEDAISRKLYKKRSASFYPPDSLANPTPGKWSLRHVALLGAAPPAVKSLEEIKFSSSDTDYLSFDEKKDESEDLKVSNPEFGPTVIDDKDPVNRLNEHLQEVEQTMTKKKEEKIDQAVNEKLAALDLEIPPVDQEPVEAPAFEEAKEEKEEEEEVVKEDVAPAEEVPAPSVEESPAPTETPQEIVAVDNSEPLGNIDVAKSEIEQLKAQLAQFEEENARLKAEKRQGMIHRRVEALFSEGKFTPAMCKQTELTDFMEGLEFNKFEFAEGESVATKVLDFLEKLPVSVDYTDYSEKSVVIEDEDTLDPHQKAMKLVRENNIEYTEAIKQVLYPDAYQ